MARRSARDIRGAVPRRVAVSDSPPRGAHNVVVVIVDSCRFDSFAAAAPRMSRGLRLGELERRHAYATWTAPSHYNLLMGLLPHSSPRHVFASEQYGRELARWSHRLGVDDLGLPAMLPRIWLPSLLRGLGYHTRALVSMPVLNPQTPLAVDFDTFELMPRHNDLGAILDRVTFDPHRPTFWLLNTGETHYPYAPAHEPESEWPRIHGLQGVFRQVAAGQPLHESAAPKFFRQDRLDALRARQVAAVEHLDGLLDRLYQMVPPGTWVVVTSDHGELFGEGGWFGHGPIPHEKVLEVPFIEGRL